MEGSKRRRRRRSKEEEEEESLVYMRTVRTSILRSKESMLPMLK